MAPRRKRLLAKLSDWIDDRTGYRTLVHALLLLNFPVQRTVRWRYIWGGALAFAFLAEIVTGVLLMTVYSPSAASAWGSVYYIQYTLAPWGSFIRGLHHWLSHLMIVLVMIHLTLIVLTAGYRAPKEFIYWSGLVLGFLVLGLAVTGNPLPWDQEGYWSYQIETSIAGTMPLVGPRLRSRLVGGVGLGHQTITPG
jgi:ubiquinol-cytochrome c reductase cytochrome b subunit